MGKYDQAIKTIYADFDVKIAELIKQTIQVNKKKLWNIAAEDAESAMAYLVDLDYFHRSGYEEDLTFIGYLATRLRNILPHQEIRDLHSQRSAAIESYEEEIMNELIERTAAQAHLDVEQFRESIHQCSDRSAFVNLFMQLGARDSRIADIINSACQDSADIHSIMEGHEGTQVMGAFSFFNSAL